MDEGRRKTLGFVELGRLYGYPECCVQAFVKGFGTKLALRYGIVECGPRTDDDPVRNAIDRFKFYVPCEACSGPHTPGWHAINDYTNPLYNERTRHTRRNNG